MKLTIKNLSFLAAVSANLILMAAPFNDGDVVSPEILKERGIRITRILKSPVDGLVDYHSGC